MNDGDMREFRPAMTRDEIIYPQPPRPMRYTPTVLDVKRPYVYVDISALEDWGAPAPRRPWWRRVLQRIRAVFKG